MTTTLMRKLERGVRLGAADGAELLAGRVPLADLMHYAHAARMRRHPEGRVTFVYDTNPNYTNVCATECRFCAFWRSERSKEAYTLSPDELAARVRSAADAGATTVLLQGGHNPAIRLADWLAYIEAIRAACPEVHIHPYSPPEIAYLAEVEGIPTQVIVEALAAAGIRTLPGGGAEVLAERVRQLIAPGKCTPAQWLAIMGQAHRAGMKTTATMMYGHVERPDEIVGHLLAVRELQDATGGFSSFIPWSFKPGRSTLGKQLKVQAHPLMYLRVIATARLLLDNVPHVQSSWFSEDLRTGQLGLLAGADDFGGLLFEESVLNKAGHAPKTSLERTLEVIRDMGFTPAQRDSMYEVVRTYPAAAGGIFASA
ncbi:MAG: CofH family radical SAM protein [Gammaproteobacteria bacterium]|nr:CofH family radical SAM protein [Gammaproteobacteria bacterium]MCP5199819.1 CofH family radical SAM protein [Gammaproteobacteria bacterium]